MGVGDFVAVGQSMAERRDSNGAERRTGDHFAAVESADAEQFHVMECGTAGTIRAGTNWSLLGHQVRRWGWRFLAKRGHSKNGRCRERNHCSVQTSHRVFSSSLLGNLRPEIIRR